VLDKIRGIWVNLFSLSLSLSTELNQMMSLRKIVNLLSSDLIIINFSNNSVLVHTKIRFCTSNTQNRTISLHMVVTNRFIKGCIKLFKLCLYMAKTNQSLQRHKICFHQVYWLHHFIQVYFVRSWEGERK